jgi:hypothetical protein
LLDKQGATDSSPVSPIIYIVIKIIIFRFLSDFQSSYYLTGTLRSLRLCGELLLSSPSSSSATTTESSLATAAISSTFAAAETTLSAAETTLSAAETTLSAAESA